MPGLAQMSVVSGPVLSRKCRVFLIDDSAVTRLIIHRLVSDAGDYEVVGQAASAEDAVASLTDVAADIILLDIELPGMNGLDAIPLLLDVAREAAVVVLSSHCDRDAEIAVRALARGATDVLQKPSGRMVGAFAARLGDVLARIAIARETAPALDDRSAVAPPTRSAADFREPVGCIAIGASTGGVHAVMEFLAALPPEIAPPILVTQHLPEDFVSYFAAQLTTVTGRTTCVAREGQRLARGTIHVAPGDAHLTVVAGAAGPSIRLRRFPVASGCCPSVDPMLSSVGDVYAGRAIGIILSGMGRDGSEGARHCAGKRGEILVQDRPSSVIWGMPGAVHAAGIARQVARPAALAGHVARRARNFGWR